MQDNSSSTTELIDDGSAVAFMQQNGQSLESILAKSQSGRRSEMEHLLFAAFTEIKKVPTTGLSLTVLLEYLGILREFTRIFPIIDATSTYEMSEVSCRALKYSK